jgi:nucleotide-binding universal stress UspA family protein
MGSDIILSKSHALDDFYQSRKRAILLEIIASLKGEETDLLSFDEVRDKLKIHGSLVRGQKEIPLDAIVGSVNRYEDFTRGFFPKSSVNPHRWANVEIAASGMAGLPPIEVYQIGEVYFVIDGNHRVSIAKHFGARSILAYVHEVPTKVLINQTDTLDQILQKADYADFLETTRILDLRPEADLQLSIPGQYYLLKEHIAVHQYFMGLDFKRNITWDEAVSHWYDTVYLPVIEIIREHGLSRDFPTHSEADLYLWVSDHRAMLEATLHNPINTDDALLDLVEQYSPRISRKSKRISQKLLDTIIPDTLESGPPVGEWRQRQSGRNRESCLFKDILVGVNGKESGWYALDEALIVSKRENAKLMGLHMLQKESDRESPVTQELANSFRTKCQKSDVDAELTYSVGNIARTIVDRSRWNDLLILNVDFPPPSNRLAKFSSGFREIVLRCPRPILVVPHTHSPLSNMLLAYDSSPKAKEALYVATYLSLNWGIPLTMISVTEPEIDIVSVQNEARTYLDSHGVSAHIIQQPGPISTAILVAAEQNGCDFIVMGGYGQVPIVNFLLDNVVDQVMRSSRIPMLLCR